MNRWMKKQINKWMNEWMNLLKHKDQKSMLIGVTEQRYLNASLLIGAKKHMNRLMKKLMNELMNEWINE